MRLHNSVLKRQSLSTKGTAGFTLVELLVATVMGSLLTMATSDLLLSHMRSSARLEGTQRMRQDWSRVTHFIESEVALSERVISDPTRINLQQCSTPINTEDFRFALEIRRDLPLSIYYIASNPNPSITLNGDRSLYRCGPGIDRNGNYTDLINSNTSSTVNAALLVDGMTQDCQINPSTIQPDQTTGSGKSLRYDLCLTGITSARYSQSISTYSRVSPIFSFPSNNTLCNGQSIEGFQQLTGGSSDPETLEVPQSGLQESDAILICGYGGGDTINGSIADDILEAGDSGLSPEPGAILNGNDGSDHLRGGPGDDTLKGGNGEDVLIGQEGNDSMFGGEGDNQYLPGSGDTTIQGGSGIDVVYINQSESDVSGKNSCSRTKCSLTFTENDTESSIDANSIEVLIFKDGRYDITS